MSDDQPPCAVCDKKGNVLCKRCTAALPEWVRRAESTAGARVVSEIELPGPWWCVHCERTHRRDTTVALLSDGRWLCTGARACPTLSPDTARWTLITTAPLPAQAFTETLREVVGFARELQGTNEETIKECLTLLLSRNSSTSVQNLAYRLRDSWARLSGKM